MLLCGFSLVAFVFMPEHVHLLSYGSQPDANVSRLLKAIKRPLSFKIKQCLVEQGSPLVSELTIRERPDVEVFRFWQEGSGYDRNLHTAQAVLASIDYLHMNPVRRRLAESAAEWKWSSARHYLKAEHDPDLPTITKLSASFLD